MIDELLPQLGVGAQVQQGQRGLRCGGIDAARDEIPEDVEQLGVVETLALEFELNEEAGQVVSSLGPSARGEFDDVGHHCGDRGDRRGVLVAVLGHGHHGMEEVGVELPIVVGQAHQPHGENGRDRAGVVEHQVQLSFADTLIEEPVRGLLHEGLHFLDRSRGEERGKGMP